MTKLSPAELSYLKDSLLLASPIRPDGRLPSQFRSVEATTDFLPSTYGSSRVRMADGAECIVGVKAEVVLRKNEASLASVSVDIAEVKESQAVISSTLEHLILKDVGKRLVLSERYAFKLYMDVLVIASTSYPLNLISFASYLALKTTRLPKLTSTVNDEANEETPTFDDDWSQSIYLYESHQQPPLLIWYAILGRTSFADPTVEEECVCDAGIFVGWHNGKVTAPIRLINLPGRTPTVGIDSNVVTSVYGMTKQIGPDLIGGLEEVAQSGGLLFG